MTGGDIYFYDLNFNLLRILPSTRYKSIIAQQDYCGTGSLDIIFFDSETGDILEDNIDNGILVIWRKFQGILTSFLRDDDEYRAVGEHLNGMVRRLTTATGEYTGTSIMWTVLTNGLIYNHPSPTVGAIGWLSVKDNADITDKIKYNFEKRLPGDEYVKTALDLIKGGYNVTADFKQQKYYLYYFKHAENNLVLSKNNLNVSSLSITCNNKDKIDGGWYLDKSSGNWHHLPQYNYTANVTYRDTVLSATNESDAKAELAKLRQKYEITLTTKNLDYGTDYKIGDIVRLQDRGKTFKMVINSVKMWEENGYGEEPTVTKYEEE